MEHPEKQFEEPSSFYLQQAYTVVSVVLFQPLHSLFLVFIHFQTPLQGGLSLDFSVNVDYVDKVYLKP